MGNAEQSKRRVYGSKPGGATGPGPDNSQVGLRRAFCVYIDTLIDGPVPADHDEKGNPVVYGTRVEAERQIVELMMVRLQEFLDGERTFDDAMTVEDYVVEVDVRPDGSIVDLVDNHLRTRDF